MKFSKKALFAGGVLALGTMLGAAGYFTPGLPLWTGPFTGAEQFGFDTELPSGASPQTAAITSAALGSVLGGQGGSNSQNGLVGGDFGTNLWQRGTTTSGVTSTGTYGADRWAIIAGASGSVSMIKETAAADITTAYSASARIQRLASNTDTTAICVAQPLTTANSVRYQGQKVEFIAHILAGADFSPAPDAVTMSIVSGTGTDQSMANLFAGSWTTQTNVVSTVVPVSTSWARYSVVGTVPAAATQVAVEICYTPVGTAGTNDWFEFTGAQLDANAGATPLTGVTGVGTARSYIRIPASEEALREYAYFYRLSEPASGAAIPAMCQATAASTNICNVFLPVPMRAAIPTIVITTAGTFKVNIAGTATTIATPTASTCASSACAVTAANTNTNGQAELLSGGGGTGKWDISAEL